MRHNQRLLVEEKCVDQNLENKKINTEVGFGYWEFYKDLIYEKDNN